MRYFLVLILSTFIFIACDSNTDTQKEDDKCSVTNITGTCENNQVCNNGVCEDIKICKNEECPENSECVENECQCKAGYADFEGSCINDLCVDPSPCTEENKGVCKIQKERPYFTCECDVDFHLEGDKCVTNEGDPCNPNPCLENTDHKTRCLWDPEDNTKFTCNCSVVDGYYEDNGICCKGGSHNEGGACVCNEGYLPNPENSEECLIECTKDTVEGFHGICENPDEICLSGECVSNLCKDVTCPENSECIVRETTAQCQCNTGLHMDNNLCCTENASNVSGTCTCDEGYALENGKCLPLVTNPCEINGNPCIESHKNTCIVDGENYICECNVGYQDDNGVCKIITTGCGDGFICLNDYCVAEGDRENEQCLTSDDCNWNGTENLYCAASALGGICNGCTNDTDCPGDLTICNVYGSCSKLCDNDNDCPTGNCAGTGYCGRSSCVTVQDCPYGSACIEGWCNRKPCIETECSFYNQNGTCEDSKTCLYGSCIDSCDPNPCTQTPLKTVCNNDAGVISCACEAGYIEDEDGNCAPETTNNCPTGFTCDNGYCADRNDPGFICSNDTDCGGTTTCSTPMTLPAGKCTGCTYKADCPHEGDLNTMECVSGYCLATCSMQSDCNAGMICAPAGSLGMICKVKDCTTAQDCPTGYVCDGSSLKCERMPCSQ